MTKDLKCKAGSKSAIVQLNSTLRSTQAHNAFASEKPTPTTADREKRTHAPGFPRPPSLNNENGTKRKRKEERNNHKNMRRKKKNQEKAADQKNQKTMKS
jgi:hypothetical protein